MKTMFKKLVAKIVEIETMEQFNAVCGEVDKEFQSEKLSWKEHELLFALLGKVMPE